MPKSDWMSNAINKLESLDLSIVSCIICMMVFVRFNRHEGKNKGNYLIAIFLGTGFLMLVGFRILTGVL
jgi:hypothetical protein